MLGRRIMIDIQKGIIIPLCIYIYINDLFNNFILFLFYQLRSTESQRVSDQDLVDEKLRSTESQRVSDLQLSDEKVLFLFYHVDFVDYRLHHFLHG
jgi:hypothetical protein